MKFLFRNTTSAWIFGIILGVFLGGSLAYPIPEYKGHLAPLGNGFSAILVSTNGPNILEMVFNKTITYSSASTTIVKHTDQVEAVLNAYGTSKEILGESTVHGLLLNNVFKNSKAYALGLRTGDILSVPTASKYLSIRSSVAKSSMYLQKSIRSGGEVDLFRKNKMVRTLRLPDAANEDVGFIEVASNVFPDGVSLPLNLILANGSSSGLALALYFLDLESPGSLAGNLSIAATGTILTSGKGNRVIAIGSLEDKYKAYERSKTDIMLIPAGNKYDSLPKDADIEGRVYLVENVEEAVKILCKLGATDKLCEKF